MHGIQVHKLLIVATLAIMGAAIVSGCSREPPAPSKGAYLHDPSLRKEMRTWCKVNPAERQGLAKCINAMAADAAVGVLSCQSNERMVDHECLERLGYPR